jgi:transcriptional regulator with XRE-family HTH domain
MTGDTIRAIRSQLGLKTADLAILLGVNATTVLRWESAGAEVPRVDPASARWLRLLEGQVESGNKDRVEDLGSRLLRSLAVGGAMFALFHLLALAYAGTTDDAEEAPVINTVRIGGRHGRGRRCVEGCVSGRREKKRRPRVAPWPPGFRQPGLS